MRGGVNAINASPMPVDADYADYGSMPLGIEDDTVSALHRMPLGFVATVLDLYAASKVFCLHLFSFESLFAVLSSVAATSAYYFLGGGDKAAGSPSFGANVSWTIVTFAVVSPMIMQIRQAFTRREQALDSIAECTLELPRCWRVRVCDVAFCLQPRRCSRTS